MEAILLLEILQQQWLLLSLFLITAILYSSVGFGGGSSYLAILALTGIAFTQIRSTALLCNIIVVSGNVLYFHQQKVYHWKKVIPLVSCSIPLAFIGGYLKISQTFFFILLGFTLFFAALSMWLSKKASVESVLKTQNTFSKNAAYGGFIGFISGMVGIGGGIFLAPILHLTHWDVPKKIAATASFFILVNSVAGLAGQYTNPEFVIEWRVTSILLITVFIGGQIGSRLSNKLLNPIQLKKATALLIAFVSIRILWKYLL